MKKAGRIKLWGTGLLLSLLLLPVSFISVFADEPKNRTQSDFIADSADMILTEDYSPDEHGFPVDQDRSGLLITSELSGETAEGCGFRFADTMSGPMRLDFRILSEKTHGLDGLSTDGKFGAEQLNPYLDTKELAVTVADTLTKNNFTIYLSGATPYHNCSVSVRVKANGMSEAKGLYYPDNDYTAKPVFSEEGYGTILAGTGFSNVATTKRNELDEDGGIPTTIGFDPVTGVVYAYARNKNFETVRVDVLNLRDSAAVGAENVLPKDSFTEYTVSVAFTDMTSDNNADLGESYARKPRMVLYGINGQSLAYGENGIVNETAPIVYLPGTSIYYGERVELKPYIYDALDGKKPYDGQITYKTSYDTTEKTLEYENGYFIELDKVGTVTFTLGAVSDGTFESEPLSVESTVFARSMEDWSDTQWNVTLPNDRPVLEKNKTFVLDENSGYSFDLTYLKTVAPNGSEFKTNVVAFALFGEYEAHYSAKDSEGNTSNFIRKIRVGDFSAPVFETEETITCNVNETLSLKPEISDYSAYEVRIEIYKSNELVSTGESFTPEVSGEYEVRYYAEDIWNNSVEKISKLVVSEPTADQPSGCNSEIDGSVYGCAALAICGLALLWLRKRGKKNV